MGELIVDFLRFILPYAVNFNGNVDVQFGPFSKAWEEVEEIKMKILGQKATLKGLSTDHKMGKFPLAGLVWSVPCPNTCPVVSGSTGTSVNQAKAMGIIVWLYLNLKGDFSIDGSVSIARLEPSNLSISIMKEAGGQMKLERSLEAKDKSGRLFVAPSIDGEITFGLTAGVTADLDFFAGGLYLANAGIDLAAKTDMGVTGTFNYGTNSLEGPWNWQGEACFWYAGGVGAIVRAAAAFGVEIDSTWDRFDVDEYYTYGFQLPTDEEILAGQSKGAWFSTGLTEICAGICSSSDIEYCYTQSDCEKAGGTWNNNQCIVVTHCSPTTLNYCYSQSECETVGGYWWADGTCNDSPEGTVSTVTSAGQVWMDRNLGASQVATSFDDPAAYGDLYQWGRAADGHESRTSSTTSTNSTTDTPGHGSFILETSSPYDWRTPQNDNLWQGVSGINNPCPSGFRLPTETELETERASWDSNDSAGAFASPLKLVSAGYRYRNDGTVLYAGSRGYYWGSTVNGIYSRYLHFSSSNAGMVNRNRASGFSVRCLED